MAIQHFTKEDMDQVMADEGVTVLSGWTEANCGCPFDEAAFKERLDKNHDRLMAKMNEELANVFDAKRTVK